MKRLVSVTLLSFVVCFATACQSPTSAGSVVNVDTFVDSSTSPNPATAVPDTDGKTYRVVRGNNQPDDILPYQYVTTFTMTLDLNSTATSSDVNLTFPVSITSISGKVEQASGGIVTPPTGGDTEHYEQVILSSTSNTFSGVGASITMTIQVWYTLPSGGKEALITESVSMKDSNSDTAKTFAKDVKIQIAR